jgi:hypothetical protein
VKRFILIQSPRDPESFSVCIPHPTKGYVCMQYESGSLRHLVDDLNETLPVDIRGGATSTVDARDDSYVGSAEYSPDMSGQRSTSLSTCSSNGRSDEDARHSLTRTVASRA